MRFLPRLAGGVGMTFRPSTLKRSKRLEAYIYFITCNFAEAQDLRWGYLPPFPREGKRESSSLYLLK
jgi:hypothetical protein